jgi:LuxR family quorum-sensing transcriptional regulator LasR
MLTVIQAGEKATQHAHAVDELIEHLLRASAVGQPLQPVMRTIMRILGFEHFGYAFATDRHVTHDSRVYVWTTLPIEWMHEYDRNAYVEVDPRITQTTELITPYVWDAATVGGGPRVDEFLEHAARYGIRSGVTLHVSDAVYPRMGAFFTSPISPVPPEPRAAIMRQLGELMLFASRFHDFFMDSFIKRGAPPMHQGSPLSAREVQCLQFAAYGLTSADIGVKLGLVERTVSFHFGNILSKLAVANRAEAVATAIARGIIRR